MEDDRPSLVDTISGYDPEVEEDRVLAALDHLDAAMMGAIARLQQRSDPPPDPGAPGSMKAAA